jgi:hypothetical protein
MFNIDIVILRGLGFVALDNLSKEYIFIYAIRVVDVHATKSYVENAECKTEM